MFKLTDTPQALPGSCYFCGSASRELYIDTGRSEEFHGAVYICVDECLREMVGLTGFITPDDAIQIKAQNSHLEDSNFILEKKISDLEMIVNGYKSLISSNEPDVFGDVSSDRELNSDHSEPAQEVVGLDEGRAEDSESAESEDSVGTPEPSNDETVGELRSSSDNDKQFSFPGI